jgi:WD40 repeat protein
MEREILSVPYSLVGGRYLGNSSRILLVGSLPNHSSRLDILNLDDNTTAAQSSFSTNMITSSCHLQGITTTLEVFGHSSVGKSFAAVASHQNGNGLLSVYEIPSIEKQHFRELSHQIKLEDSIYTSIASHSNNNQLTASTEFGDVIVHDFSGQEITRFNADYCGLKAIKYSPSGDLITLGLSSGGQLSLWDTRLSSHSPSLIRCLRPPPLSSSPTVATSLTSVLTSHRNDYDMICGTSTGSIIQWDTRSDGVIFSPHQVHSLTSAGL